jgi:carbamoyl-phosphate synthase small subunit
MDSIMKKIFLYLEDGTHIEATSFGYLPKESFSSEIVFNTSMQGYQEILSDPSYCDQSVIMTYPLIGNYGINHDDNESISPSLKALIVKEYCNLPSNFRVRQKLSDYLILNKVVGICDIDTRFLTKKIRSQGTLKSVISLEKLEQSNLKHLFDQDLKRDQISRVSTKKISHFPSNGGKRVVMIDFGYKKNILESLLKRGCDVILVPYNTSYDKIIEFKPQGIVLSNGPGDPKNILEIIPTIQKLQESFPLFAICMGHQIFALANKANTAKMKFGHRGANHPVQDLNSKRVYITSQNHGYSVTEESIKDSDLEITQVNLNDKSIEGLRHKKLPAFSVQYHPEASPGPNDTKYLFDEFTNSLKEVDHA